MLSEGRTAQKSVLTLISLDTDHFQLKPQPDARSIDHRTAA